MLRIFRTHTWVERHFVVYPGGIVVEVTVEYFTVGVTR